MQKKCNESTLSKKEMIKTESDERIFKECIFSNDTMWKCLYLQMKILGNHQIYIYKYLKIIICKYFHIKILRNEKIMILRYDNMKKLWYNVLIKG